MGKQMERDSHIQNCGNLMNSTYVSGDTRKHVIHDQGTVYSILFPYHCYRGSTFSRQEDRRLELFQGPSCSNSIVSSKRHWSKLFSNFSKFNVFPKVYASDTENHSDANTGEGSGNQTNNINTGSTGDITRSGEQLLQSSTIDFEALARAYIARETGMDRVRMVFTKNHKGESSPQILCFKAALLPISLISFFMSYVPAYKFAKSEFIREHNATVFKTPIEAARKMSDYASLKAIIAGSQFTIKITTFSVSFLIISQALASYRNKTSVRDATIAAGITGGLARFNMGPKGVVSGSVIGMALGAVYGVITSSLLYMFGATEDAMHLEAVITRLEVERSIAGDSIFKQRMKELLTELASDLPTSSW